MPEAPQAPAAQRLEIRPEEHRQRLARLQEVLASERLDGICVFGPARVAYLTGFFFAATERPVALVVPREGEAALFIPRLEGDHAAQQVPWLSTVETYPEYPGGGSGRHPLLVLGDFLRRLGLGSGALAADLDGYEHRWGYRGPRLSAVLARPVAERLELIDDLRTLKSPAEVTLIREACRWGDHAHRLMQDAIRVGADELLVSHGASLNATRDMLAELGARYAPKSREGMPAQAMFIRGANTANPHGLHQGGGVQTGDVLVTGAFALVGGYESELERTMIVGEPTSEVERCFAAMVAAQDAAFRALRPGRSCAEVEAEVSAFITRELGLGHALRHHTGHAFGLEGHEHPFLDLDDPTPIEPGMIFSLEPGLYIPGLAGFRYSDTVLVTEDGCQNLCGYPRDLASLSVPA